MSKKRKQPLKYIKQYDKYSCGAVAVLNALKWAGYDLTYRRDFKRICKLCKCNVGEGTFPWDLDAGLRRHRKLAILPEEEAYSAPSIKLVDKLLSLGSACIISYIYKYRGQVCEAHVVLCIGKKGKQYVMVNRGGRCKTVCLIPRQTMVRMLRYSDADYGGSDVWFVFRLKDKQ